MALLRHFGSSDSRDQQVAHGNQNICALAQDKEMEAHADALQGQRAAFLRLEALNAAHEAKAAGLRGLSDGKVGRARPGWHYSHSSNLS